MGLDEILFPQGHLVLETYLKVETLTQIDTLAHWQIGKIG